jgi:hypothetical protein
LFDLQRPRRAERDIQTNLEDYAPPAGIAWDTELLDQEAKIWGRIVKAPGGRYWAFGYRYALVLQRRLTWDRPWWVRHDFATIGMARDGERRWLVTAPWIPTPERAWDRYVDRDSLDDCLIIWWPFNDYGYLDVRRGEVQSHKIAKADTYNIQGVCADRDIVWFCTSNGAAHHTLATFRVADSGRLWGYWADDTLDWPEFGEGLTYAPSRDHLWNVTEYPKDRSIVFCIDRSKTRSDIES